MSEITQRKIEMHPVCTRLMSISTKFNLASYPICNISLIYDLIRV